MILCMGPLPLAQGLALPQVANSTKYSTLVIAAPHLQIAFPRRHMKPSHSLPVGQGLDPSKFWFVMCYEIMW